MSVLDDIQANILKQQQNPYATAGGSDTVNAINQQYNADLLNSLGQLSNKYSGQLNTYGQQMSKAKTEGQDTLEQNALDEAANQRRARETMANNGTASGGEATALESQIRTALENANNKVFQQRQDDQATIQSAVDELNKEGAVDLQGALQLSQTTRDAAVRQQQANEEEARRQEEAMARAQAAAEEQARAQEENNRLVADTLERLQNKGMPTLEALKQATYQKAPDDMLLFMNSIDTLYPGAISRYAGDIQVPDQYKLWIDQQGNSHISDTLADYAKLQHQGYINEGYLTPG